VKHRNALDRALRIWGNKPWYKNQVARTSFLKGKHLVQMGGEFSTQGHAWIQKAKALRREITREDDEGEATKEDFDKLVVFWSR
jgi:hypothetical protein